ncbi:MAG: zinc-dependent alcohol dehydrogenase family protein, partial [Geminicoccaceae bacterium]|nr:zinc-dependent alcohol dehydrogenase family protein [Geminicoccaceae bacterium]
MQAMILERPGQPLRMVERPDPQPGPGEVRVRVGACAVCRTDLHLVDGELPDPKLPIVPGHEIVGRIEAVGLGVEPARVGTRVGIPWLGWTCGRCDFCTSGLENLCRQARFTGYQIDGGYAEATIADARYCFDLADRYDDASAAPLLCAGLIGHRSLRMAGAGRRLGLYGFGAAAHIVCQVALHQGREVYAFVRSGDERAAAFARSLGACWAGPSEAPAPVLLDAAIVFAPIGALVPAALRAVREAGTVVLGGIHMSDIPSFPYRILWGERVVRSVANLTRQDALDFLAEAPLVPVRTQIERLPLGAANEAL